MSVPPSWDPSPGVTWRRTAERGEYPGVRDCGRPKGGLSGYVVCLPSQMSKVSLLVRSPEVGHVTLGPRGSLGPHRPETEEPTGTQQGPDCRDPEKETK